MEQLKSIGFWSRYKFNLISLILFSLFATAAMSGNFDNLGFNGNTISSRNTNGNIIFSPNGTGEVELNYCTASTVPYLDSNKGFKSSAVTPTELGYVSGVTSSIQTQFSGKQATGNYITALTGDVSASGPGSATATLATVNSNTGSFGSGTSIPNFTVNGKGLITAAGSNSISGITNSNLSGSAGVTNANLANMSNNTIKSNVSGSTGTPADNTLTAIIDSAVCSAQGSILYRNSSAWVCLAPSTSGNVLQTNGSSANPSWVAPGSPTFSGLTTNGVMYANASTTVASTAAGPTASVQQVLTETGTGSATQAPVFDYPNKQNYRSVTSTDGSTNADSVLILSGPSFTETLYDATASGNTGRIVKLVHNGTSLTNKYTIATTSSQTISYQGIAYTSGQIILYTQGEVLTVQSNGSNWVVLSHIANTGWVADTITNVGFETFTVASSSVTIGAVYTVSTATCTAAATISSSTTLVMVCNVAPPASGSLTKSSGTGSSPISYSAVSGNTANPTATTTSPVPYGSPTTNTSYWMRNGAFMTHWINYYQATAGTSAGSGDYLWLVPGGMAILTSIYPTNTLNVGANPAIGSLANVNAPANGITITGTALEHFTFAIPYSTTLYRIYANGWNGGAYSESLPLGSGVFQLTDIVAYNWKVTFPINGWLP